MIFRLRDFIRYPREIWKAHSLLAESQYWTPDDRRAWIQERLAEVLEHAVEHVPYYRRTLGPYRSRFNDVVDRLDLSELPILTKDHIRNHFDELCADDADGIHPHATHTSGSTGTPTQFYLDRVTDVFHFASIWRVLNWSGYRFGDRFADLTGYLPKNDGLYQYDARLNCLHLSSFNFKMENMEAYVEKLNTFRPVLIKAYPSAIDLFARWLNELDLPAYTPESVLTCAETLFDHQRQMVESVLKCKVFDFYNQNERAVLISTCEHGTYHIHEEYSFAEFLKSSDAPGMDPNTRAIVATTFHSRAMPLIRYQTNDLASVDGPGTCPCGRTYKSVRRIVGRVEDLIVTPDGRHVGRLDAAFKYSSGIRLSQVVQESPEEIVVRLVKADTFEQKDVDRIEDELRSRLGPVIGIRYEYVDDILPGKNGKVKFVISKPGKQALLDLDSTSVEQ